MKKLSIVVTALALLAVGSCGITRMTPEEKKAEKERVFTSVDRQLNQRNFTIDINYMTPMRGSGKSVTTYSLTVDGNVLKSHLPYFGVARRASYGGGNALSFEEDIKEYYDSGFNGDRRTIYLTVDTKEDSFTYKIEIFDNGTASVSVNCRNRDDISYRGNLRVD